MSSYYIGNYNLSDNSKSSFYIAEPENNKENEEVNESETLFNYIPYKKFIQNDSVSPSTQTFIYLNRKDIGICVRKKPQIFKHLLNNSIINKYLI